jgi:hypothetical protein
MEAPSAPEMLLVLTVLTQRNDQKSVKWTQVMWKPHIIRINIFATIAQMNIFFVHYYLDYKLKIKF